MMKPIEYIKTQLEKFVKIFKQTQVRYELSSDGVTHIIEVLPRELYYTNEQYLDWENSFFDEFISLYPYENVCFITDDSPLTITDPILTVTAPISIHSESDFNIQTNQVTVKSSKYSPVVCFDLAKNVIPESHPGLLPINTNYILAA